MVLTIPAGIDYYPAYRAFSRKYTGNACVSDLPHCVMRIHLHQRLVLSSERQVSSHSRAGALMGLVCLYFEECVKGRARSVEGLEDIIGHII